LWLVVFVAQPLAAWLDGCNNPQLELCRSTDLWYKNAVIYCLDVEKYQDGNNDGIGDFEGLMRRLDYLSGLGASCVWLQPFYPSPNRDNGYDVADYYGVHEKHGSLGDFVNFMNHADDLGEIGDVDPRDLAGVRCRR
jgi:1,4-alpha-glucan branching enzyme